MQDTLSVLFGGQARVKLIRFFLFNRDEWYEFDDISRRARLVRRTARTEMNTLEKAGLIKKKQVQMVKEGKKVKVTMYATNKDFSFLSQLHAFFHETAPLDAKTVLGYLQKIGKLDVVVMAGIFVKEPDQRVDLLISMKTPLVSKVETAIRGIEAEIGMGIRFTLLETSDLQYRLGMYDKHTRDVFDFNHMILVDRIGLRNELAKPWVM